ncbi:MAG TPA: ABC transporter permease [Holophagaceae bacterium]|jgi:sodium transport system permease protein|nr:ABC transporter permease [Holophagaceae bacterium]
MRGAWLIMKKELLELSKDRRTLFFTFAMPLILYPVIFGVMGKMSMRDEADRKSRPSRVYLVDPGSVLAPALQADPKDFQIVAAPEGGLSKALRDKKLEMALEVPASASEDLKAQRTLALTATINRAEDDSQLALKRLNDLLKTQDKTWVDTRLQALNASPQLAEPSKVEVKNAADLALELGKSLGIWIPYIILISMFSSVMGHGSSMTAGERERGTLMSLLSTRISRGQIALGKLMALFALGALSVVSNVAGSAIGFNMLGHDIAAQSAATGAPATTSLLQMASPSTLGLTLLLLVPVSLVMVAFVMTVGIRAKSQREAATALMPGMFVIIMLGVFSMAPGIEKMSIIPFVPIINASVAIREMFGQQFNWVHYLLALGINTTAAIAFTALATKTLNREDVLFKS